MRGRHRTGRRSLRPERGLWPRVLQLLGPCALEGARIGLVARDQKCAWDDIKRDLCALEEVEVEVVGEP